MNMFLAFTILFFSQISVANIYRHCSAAYKVTPRAGGATRTIMAAFKGRGGCGRWVPNRCRERARNRAHTCMGAHWRNRFVNWTPVECTEDASVFQYSVTNLDKELKLAICRIYRRSEMRVKIQAVTWGDDHCDKSRTLAENFFVRCW